MDKERPDVFVCFHLRSKGKAKSHWEVNANIFYF